MIRIATALATMVGLANVAGGQVVRERIFGAPYAQFGSTVASIGDVDRDGIADYAVGEPNYNVSSASHEGRVWLYSGASGTLLRVHVGSAGDSLGASVRGAGDVDGDGADDVLVGAPQHSSSNFFEEGLAVVFSGSTGNVIWSVHGSDDFQHVGVCVDSTGDLDGDGRPEALVGSAADFAWVVDANGAVLHDLRGGLLFGHAVAGIDDVDADLVPDLLVGEAWFDVSASQPRRGRVWVLSGATATTLFTVDGTADHDYLGRTLSRLGDVDGDAIPDFIAASYVSSQGDPGIGTTCALDFGNSRGVSTPGLLIVGFASASIALPFGATLLVDPTLLVPVTVPAAGLVITGSIPDDPTLGFTELFLQGVEFDPGAVGKLALTAGLELTLGFDL